MMEAFKLIDHENKGYVPKEEISYLMRFLNQFPSEAQVRDYIIPKLEDDEPSDFIKYEKFEAYMTEVVFPKNEFEPSPAEHLLAAFRILDPEGQGYIKKDVMKNLIKMKGIKFRDEEYTAFKNYALDKTGKFFYYEDYVSKLIEENDRHHEFLLRDYDSFKSSLSST